jgi:hypothetical protein
VKCEYTWNPGTWPYIKRCTKDATREVLVDSEEPVKLCDEHAELVGDESKAPTFRLEIHTGNAAFEEGSLSTNLVRCLERVIQQLSRTGVPDDYPIVDENGNRVGRYTYG